MKISKMIKHLEYSMKEYGDNDVKIFYNDEEDNTTEFETVFFSDCIEPDKTELCIQNFPI